MMTKIISMKGNCVPIVSSSFGSLYKGPGYQQQYDQQKFLNHCGVNRNLEFLGGNQNAYYLIKNV